MIKPAVIVLLLLPSLLFGQSDSVRKSDVVRFADGVLRTYSAPLKWKGRDWLKLGTIAGGTALLSLADQPVRQFWSDKEGAALSGINEVGYHYGKPYSAFAFSAGFYTAGLLIKNDWARETGLALGTSLLTAGLLEMGLKTVVGRARPSKEEGNYSARSFSEEAGYHSFPSGHASMAFTISFVLAKRVESIPLKVFFYSMAGSTVVCRLYSDAHWISDIAFGAVIAWYASEAAIKGLELNKFRRVQRTQWKFTPYPGGITLRGVFR